MMSGMVSLCRRLSIKDLVANSPVYTPATHVSGEGLSLMFRRWGTKKSAGSTKNGCDSLPKNLGVKKFGGEWCLITLGSEKEGCVKFERHKLIGRKWIHVEPKEGQEIHPIYASAAGVALKMKTTA